MKNASFNSFYGVLTAILWVSFYPVNAQIQVSPLIENINASGGVTVNKSGKVYISDFGSRLGKSDEITKVYVWDPKTGKTEVFAEGFMGASGACFDDNGNFYQSNPFGNKVSRVNKKGDVDLNFLADTLVKLPVGLSVVNDDLYVCNCGGNYIGRYSKGQYERFAESELFKCPNGMTKDDRGNLYVCNFGGGEILKIDQEGTVSVFAELPTLQGGPNPVGNGHLTWKNGNLFVTTIGSGQVFLINAKGESSKIAGIPFSFKNNGGNQETAAFSKPNGIAASVTGDTLYINVSDPTWITDPTGLHPAHLYMITGVCELVECSN